MRASRHWMGAAMLVGAWLCAPRAQACGGTFCDSAPPGQPPMPVDQVGENVLFFLADGHVEAHVQIQYTGTPERFAWVIPVPEMPELSVGSQPLFLRLQNSTVPTFSLTTSVQFCSNGSDEPSSSAGCGFALGPQSSDQSGGYAPSSGGNSSTDSEAPQVALRQSVGAFEAVVLEPTTAQGMLDWLSNNGFDSDAADSAPVIGDYVNKGYKFVAIKLRPAAGTGEIHPLVIRYPGSEPCVPLRLTQVAAVEDMAVRVFFLGNERVVPTNYKHVQINPARLDFRTFGANYDDVVTRAVDSPVANGHAFVTEYAGASSAVSSAGLVQPSWADASFLDVPASAVVNELSALGLMSCVSAASCTATHPLVFPLLDRYLPPPAGVTPAQYYSCISCYDAPETWDATAFDDDFAAMILEPAEHAAQMLSAAPYLTRMLTRISPAEMTEDPMFRAWSEPLPTVSPAYAGSQTQECDGDIVTTTSDGRSIYGGSFGSSPALPAEMPWAQVIEEFSDSGQHVALVDNTTSIVELLAAHNSANNQTSTSTSAARNDDSGGCGCSMPGRDTSHGMIVAGLLGLAFLRRSRRRHRRRSG